MSSKVRDYEKLAGDIIAAVGGKDNISEAAHCSGRFQVFQGGHAARCTVLLCSGESLLG